MWTFIITISDYEYNQIYIGVNIEKMRLIFLQAMA